MQAKRVIIQHSQSGKIKEISKVAWDVMVKHKLDRKWILVNPGEPPPIIKDYSKRKKAVKPAEVVIVEDVTPIEPIEEPKSEPTNE